ncbi:hypothetical protein NIES2130_29500 [Scytonema sp. HK-05]|nr:hypothetical protein NIES2130_29500 [Scytonema sp. HK-05]
MSFPQSRGFLGRKSDGEPGVKTIWRGLRRLHDIALTWKLLECDSPSAFSVNVSVSTKRAVSPPETLRVSRKACALRIRR